MDKIFWLIFAHFMGDIAFQSQFLTEKKRESFFFLIAHSIIYTGCIGVVLVIFGHYALWKIWFLIIGHILIDKLKIEHHIRLHTDQTLHATQLLICLI